MEDQSDDTESLVASLIREFLSRKGLTHTLATLDQESPRRENSIGNRAQLARSLGVEKLMRKNKEAETPYRTILEVVTANLVEKVRLKNGFESLEKEKKKSDKSEDMYRRMKEDGQITSASDDLVLEDTEEGETFLGDGHVANQRPDSGHVTGNQRMVKQKLSGGRITSSLNDREQEKLKRMLNKPRYSIEDDTKTREPYNAPDHGYQVFESPGPGRAKAPEQAKRPVPEKRTSIKTPPRENSAAQKSEKIDARKIFHDVENDRNSSWKKEEEITIEMKPKQEVKKKVKTRAELLAMLEMDDPNDMRPNALENSPAVEDAPSVEDVTSSKLGDLELGDLDEDDLLDAELIDPVPAKLSASVKRQSTPIDFKTAVELKTVIFGTPLQQFYDEWKLQSFTFPNWGKTMYGIVQKKGGPCGVLAAVQACCLQELLFGANGYDDRRKRLTPMRSERTEALSDAVMTILWRCGDYRTATVALPGGRALFSGSSKFKADGLTETLMLTKFDDASELSQFVRSNVKLFESENSPGVVLLLYSAILSRTVAGVRSDMDDAGGKLMGQHFYCTQDMVNLLLTGRASSNSFNDVIELRGDDDVTVLKGLTKRSDIGFLSLFEHFKSCQVGTYYKTPKYPIWVVCCESHFSVLFSTRKELVSDWKAERRFDLFFYDGLAGQYEEIMLTVDTTSRFYTPPVDVDMVPPLENCIRTKWPEAAIDWNGTEPLL